MTRSAAAALATAAVAVSGFLPWARSGDLSRSGYALAGAARDAGLAGGPVTAAVALGVVALPLLASVAWLAATAGRRAVVAACAAVAALLGTAAAGVVLGSDLVEPRWGLLAGVAAAVTAAAQATTLAWAAGVSTRLEVRPPRPPAPGPRPRRWSPATIVGAAAMAASLVFAAVSVPTAPGSDSAEAAVRALLEAAASKDVLGVTGALVPAEREPLRPSLVKLARELRRFELISQEGSLARIGASVTVDDVDLRATPLGDGRVAVRVTGGRIATRLDPAGRSLGDFVRALAGLLGVPVARSSGAPGDGTVVVAVREGGRWYVSFWASVAEASQA